MAMEATIILYWKEKMGMENGEEKYITSNSRNASFPLHCSIILRQWH
jgi:hypothetical protein